MASVPNAAAVASSAGRLVIERLSKSYVAGKPVLTDVSLTVDGAGITAIIARREPASRR